MVYYLLLFMFTESIHRGKRWSSSCQVTWGWCWSRLPQVEVAGGPGNGFSGDAVAVTQLIAYAARAQSRQGNAYATQWN